MSGAGRARARCPSRLMMLVDSRFTIADCVNGLLIPAYVERRMAQLPSEQVADLRGVLERMVVLLRVGDGSTLASLVKPVREGRHVLRRGNLTVRVVLHPAVGAVVVEQVAV